MSNLSYHQQKQIKVVNSIEQQVNSNLIGFSTVAPVRDYKNDTRICLTSVHLPHQQLITRVQDDLIKPLQQVSPDIFYYPTDALHMTIKNIRVISDPPNFSQKDIENVMHVFESVIPKHKKFHVYFYRLLMFQNNLALIGTTDPELDSTILDLNTELNKANMADDKKYMNSKYFFSNMTLARFNGVPSKKFLQTVEDLSKSVSFEPYAVDSVTLLTCNAVLMRKNIIKTWKMD